MIKPKLIWSLSFPWHHMSAQQTSEHRNKMFLATRDKWISPLVTRCTSINNENIIVLQGTKYKLVVLMILKTHVWRLLGCVAQAICYRRCCLDCLAICPFSHCCCLTVVEAQNMVIFHIHSKRGTVGTVEGCWSSLKLSFAAFPETWVVGTPTPL